MNAKQSAVVLFGQRAAVVDDERVCKTLGLLMSHRLEVAKCEWIGQVAVFAEALLVIAALDVMKAAGIGAVVSAVDATLGVDFQSERVAAAFGEDFVLLQLGVIAPDKLTLRVDGRFVAR